MAVAAAVFTGEVDVALRSMVSVKHFGFLVFWYLVNVACVLSLNMAGFSIYVSTSNYLLFFSFLNYYS